MSDYDGIPPPASLTVYHEHKPVIYTPDGKAYVRQAGFVTEPSRKTTPQTHSSMCAEVKPGEALG